MVSVVIPTYAMERWHELCEAVVAVKQQTVPVRRIVVVVDHNAELLTRARRELPGVTVVANAGSRGASGARNTGAVASKDEVVAFIDDDMLVRPTWLEALLSHFSMCNVVGVGGRSEPLWPTVRPRWLAPELDWAVGVSYRGMPAVSGPVRNVWSGNMAVRREIFEKIGGFRDGFGKIGHRSNPEDTDLCLRATAASSGGVWIYEPAGVASHRIPREYTTLPFILTRCFGQGRGKASLAVMNGMGRSTSTERWYVRRVLPDGIARGFRETARGDLFGVCRSIVIAAALFMALLGFASDRAAATVRISDADQARSVSRVDGARVLKRRKGTPEQEVLTPSVGSPNLQGRLSGFAEQQMILRSSVTLTDASKGQGARRGRDGRDGAA